MAKEDVLIVTPFYEPKMEEAARHYAIHKLWEAKDKAALLAAIAERCRAVATNGTCSADVIAALPKLEIISSFGVGYDGVDIEAASRRGVKVTNTPDVLSDEVADLAIGLIIAVSRKMVAADQYVRAGQWLKANFPYNQTIGGRKLGILGLGRIGRAIAERAIAHKMEVSYHSRTKKDAPYPYHPTLLEMAKAVDVLVAIVPGGPGTAKIVNRAVLDALGPEGIFINVARGSVVDDDALIAALREGTLGGAGLDVFTNEPEVPQALIDMTGGNVVLQPHQASATHATRAKMGQLVLDNLAAHFASKPLLTPVN